MRGLFEKIMNTNNKIYLDSNFLVYWALPKDNGVKKKVRVWLAKFLSSRAVLTTSCLAIDEAWHGIKQTYNKQNDTSIGCAEEPIYSQLNNFTSELIKKINIIQFSDPKAGTQKALEYVKNYKLKPRDAFHLAIMKNNFIEEIITNDSDFERIKSNADIKVSF